MLNIAYRNSFSEIIDILKHMKKEDVQKISPEFIEYLKRNASPNYVSTLNHSKTIKEMNLSPRTKAILALIYKKYWNNTGENESQKDINLNKNISVGLNTETDMFTEQIVELEPNSENKQKAELILHKESFLEKFLNKIKSIFKKEKSKV